MKSRVSKRFREGREIKSVFSVCFSASFSFGARLSSTWHTADNYVSERSIVYMINKARINSTNQCAKSLWHKGKKT